ncbi:ribokinase [Virgibacillus sp. NKC19-3]|uniref:PfkB family carbohydrate kinase n=1 Tax=Virgibacillus saliphilus TaxID=2831674 RepID=UPI001C9A57C4|nr:PfkB family carbohydrate kinase [Virgibacillus sp. NKC19-3]MBY7144543.1 ribokinase [Virgibacillus sp. NKC19-3]
MPKKQHLGVRRINSEKKVLVIGSAVIDIVVNIPRLPVSGEDVFSKSQEVIVGGCAYNVGNILKQLNASYDLMIPIGNGPNAAHIKEQMNADDHAPLMHNLNGDNGWCLSMVEANGERTFLTVPGIENSWKEEWFEKVDFSIYDYIYLSGYTFEGNSANVLLEQLQNKSKETAIIFDPSPRVSNINEEDLKALLKLDTIVHCNREELLSLSGLDNIEAGAKMIHQQTNNPVVVTLGGEGTLFVQDNISQICNGKDVPLIDTIGAGDTHIGAFITALLDGQSIETACTWGNDAASQVVQVQGGNVKLS